MHHGHQVVACTTTTVFRVPVQITLTEFPSTQGLTFSATKDLRRLVQVRVLIRCGTECAG